MRPKPNSLGFTLIEVLVVISIMGLLSSIASAGLGKSRAQARDTRRISDMQQLRLAINMYMTIYGQFPQQGTNSSGECNGGWDSSSDGDFIPELTAAGFLNKDILDPSINNNNFNCGNYQYAHADAGDWGCDPSRGRYYILQIIDLESTPGFPGSGAPINPKSPGFSCPLQNFNNYAEYVIGEFEK